MLESYATGLVQALHTHPHWGFALTFFIAFIESLAVIGTIVPGSITMTAIGALVGARVMPASWVFLIAILGALCGDLLSYWFGRHYEQRIVKMWPFTTHPHWITAGESFFKKHGVKGVIIGRFFGPVRSFVPLVAGLMRMHPLYFFLAAIPSATLWAIAYLSPGILIGALSMELPASLATKFIVVMLFCLVSLWFIVWLVKFISQKLWSAIDLAISTLWQAMRARKAWHFITTPLADPREPDLHDQLMLAFCAVLAFSMTFILLWNITQHGLLTALNVPVYHLLQSIRTPALDSIMTIFTLLGDRKCILSFAVLMLGWLTWQRHWRAAAHWCLLMVLVIGSALAIKHGYYSPRPSLDLPSNSTSSLPSGHTIFTLAFFGFVAVLIGHELPRPQKKRTYLVALTVILLAAFSRIYLGPHWLTDILASFLLGLGCLLVVTLSYRRHLTTHVPPKQLGMTAVTLMLVLWSGYSAMKYPSTLAFHRQPLPILALKDSDWWANTSSKIPTVRINRLGRPDDLLNIQWQGELTKILAHLQQQGWTNHSAAMDLTSFLQRLSLQDPERRLPLLPPLYHNRPPALIMTKPSMTNHYDIVLYLWVSDIHLTNSTSPLWIGTLKQYEDPHKKLLQINSKSDYSVYRKVLPTLLNDTRTLQTKEITAPIENGPEATGSTEIQPTLLLLR